MNYLVAPLRIRVLTMLLFSALHISAQSNFGALSTSAMSCRVYSDLEFFYDSQTQNNYFETPVGSGKRTIYDYSIWIGGLDNAKILQDM